MGKKSNLNLDSGKVLKFIVQNFKVLFLISAVAFIASIVVSFKIQPKFKSVAIIFPASADYKSWFGLQDEVDQLMQVFNSSDIKDEMIRKFDLYRHYHVDSSSKYAKSNINNIYNDLVSISRTRYMSIKVEVLDADPVIAARIANELALYCDSFMNIFQLEKAGKNAVLYEEQVKERMSFMSTLADSLNYLGVNKGISNVENQAKEYTKAYNEAVISGNEKARNAFELKLKELGKYSGTYQLQSEQIKYESENLAKLRTNLYDAKSQLTQGNPYFYKFVVEHAKISDKKDSPKRLLIVLLSTLSAFLFTFMVLVLKKNISNTFKE